MTTAVWFGVIFRDLYRKHVPCSSFRFVFVSVYFFFVDNQQISQHFKKLMTIGFRTHNLRITHLVYRIGSQTKIKTHNFMYTQYSKFTHRNVETRKLFCDHIISTHPRQQLAYELFCNYFNAPKRNTTLRAFTEFCNYFNVKVGITLNASLCARVDYEICTNKMIRSSNRIFECLFE